MSSQYAHRVGKIWLGSQHQVYELANSRLELLNMRGIRQILGLIVRNNLRCWQDSLSYVRFLLE